MYLKIRSCAQDSRLMICILDFLFKIRNRCYVFCYITLHSSLLTLSSMVLFSVFQYISRQMGSCYILLQGNIAYGTQCITQGSDEEHR